MRPYVAVAVSIAGLAVLASPGGAQIKNMGRPPAVEGNGRGPAAAPAAGSAFTRFPQVQRPAVLPVAAAPAAKAKAAAFNPPHFPEHVGSDGSIGVMGLWNAKWGWPSGYFGCGEYLITFSSDVARAYGTSPGSVADAPPERSAAFRAPAAPEDAAYLSALAAASGVVLDLR